MTPKKKAEKIISKALHSRSIYLISSAGLATTYFFMFISFLLFMGAAMSAAFITTVSIENHTDEAIFVTPVGTVGKQGNRHPLPICFSRYLPIWSSRRGGFKISSGESINLNYDMDDINFSEIVVHNQHGEQGQLVVNPNPTQNQYHAPSKRDFLINDLNLLVEVPNTVRNAAHYAQIPTNASWILISMLIGPWVVWVALFYFKQILTTSKTEITN